jgi:superfamily II DNA or RNA helicase
MVTLPKFLQKYKKEAQKVLDKGWVKEIEFSGPTYQVKVADPQSKKEVWAFLQLDSKGSIKDSFCSCDEGESCIHIAASYLRIFDADGYPLHQRFQKSLWNKICFLFLDHCGDDPYSVQEEEPNHFTCTSAEGVPIFFAKAKNAKGEEELRNNFFTRTQQTEENSLKFSNLSEDELELWREGRPSFELRYELSFWNDLAKRLFMMQDEGSRYKISFRYSPKGIPNEILIGFADFEIGFSLSEASLSFIIPGLDTVDAPLTIHQADGGSVQKITYDKITQELIIDEKIGGKGKTGGEPEEGIPVNGWIFVPKDGFYSNVGGEGFKGPRIPAKSIPQTLKEKYAIIKSKMKGTELHLDPVHVSYSVYFDNMWNLHLVAYLFEPGDLSTEHSQIFGEWIYLEDDGFYPVEGLVSDKIHQLLHPDQVEDFIKEHRSWIGHQEGFQFHVSGIETQLSYTMNSDGDLVFKQKPLFDELTQDCKDFGEWVYVRGEGFYSKSGPVVPGAITPGTEIRLDQIPLFMRQHREELQLIPGFFIDISPVSKAGVRVVVQDDQTILVSPEYVILDKYRDKAVRILEEFAYLPGKGFCELQGEARLPESFRHAIHITKDKLHHFITVEMNLIKPFALYIDPRLKPPKQLDFVAETVTREDGNYALKMVYRVDSKSIKFGTLWQALHSRHHYLFTELGLIDLHQERFHPMRWVTKKKIDLRSNQLIVSPMELLRLMAFDELKIEKGQAIVDLLIKGGDISEPDLTGMEGALRTYQVHGVHWLWSLYHRQLSGLLCDDMGLGKTHQAMALLVAVRNQQHERKPFLIICPTSVLYHWEEKLKIYLPELKVCTFHGTGRSLGEYDVLLTSYGIWRREYEFLSKFAYDVAIFDEIQAAKNPSSLLFTSLKEVKAKMRLGLTGTPIENRLQDLKALFDLTLPNYMPPEEDYKRFFVLPIERDRDIKRQILLTRYIKPFILRRRKKEVLLDLPEKVEEISHCDLSSEQVRLYNDVLLKMRQGIESEIQKGTVSYIHIFAVLSALKQICNHPAAYLKRPEEYKDFNSGKWDLFLELLNEARESQQKVVVFSQYLAMLDIMESYLNENQIKFATIRGSTIERGREVDRFNKDPQCEVFLGSLQAAGWGIDLTGASVVIHYDRWWNAAREDQATDRVHRIGQTRGVQVFKLVTKGTFEERIDTLITQKGKMMEDVVGFDDHQFIKKFTQEEILQLLQEVKL